MDKLTYNTKELKEKYTVIGFGFGYCVVRNKINNKIGTFDFKDRPRVYFDYKKH